MMRTPSLIRLVSTVGIAALALFALDACAPATTPTASPSAHHPHVKPSPTPTQAVVPTVRVPVTCGSMFTDSTAASLIGVPVKYHIDQTTNPVDIIDVVARQYGSLICLWGGAGRTDGGYDENLTVEVTPDAAQGYTSNLSSLQSEQAPVVSNSAGDQSVYGCAAQNGLNCIGNMVVGSYWVTASIQSLDDTSTTHAIASSRMQQALTAIAAQLKNTTPRPAWNPPGSSLPSFCSDSGSTAQVNAALGETDFAVTGEDDGPADAESYTQQPGVYDQCSWGNDGDSTADRFSYLEIAMVKGGAWVMPQLAGEQDQDNYMLGAYSPLTIPGADTAVSSCSVAAQQCAVYLTIGSTLVFIDLDDPGETLVDTAVSKLVAAIRAS